MSAFNLIELGLAAQRLSVSDFTIPMSIRSPSQSLTGWPFQKPGECWDCGTPIKETGAYKYCSGCWAGLKAEYRRDDD